MENLLNDEVLIDDKNFDPNDIIDQRLTKNRLEWSKKMSDVINDMRDVHKLTDVNVMMLSYRHQLVDSIAEFQNKMTKILNNYEIKYKEKFIFYHTNYDIKLTGAEKDKFIRADIGKIKIQIQKFEIQVDFYKDCIKTLDNLGFAIKTRMKLHEDGF